MADTISPERRSRNMSAIKSRDTNPEVYLRKLLYHLLSRIFGPAISTDGCRLIKLRQGSFAGSGEHVVRIDVDELCSRFRCGNT